MRDTLSTLTTDSASLEATYKPIIEHAFATPPDTWTEETNRAVDSVIDLLDQGLLRLMSKKNDQWHHHAWLQKAILCYIKLSKNESRTTPFLSYLDKIPSKFDRRPIDTLNCRVVPPSHVRYGSYIGKQCVLMPCFVNIGAYIGEKSMIDTWATVGSGAQIGKHVHISGGVGIGGVLEPPQATPTIIEDHCFIGARSEIAEGMHIKEGAVIAMGTFLSRSTKIYDRVNQCTHTGYVPENAVVVPGSLPAKDNSHHLYAAIIVKYADAQTRAKTSINDILRDF
jgi:2,3,4,5-tetrahydropyridine-2-carboxylate N-succinyltransferase